MEFFRSLVRYETRLWNALEAALREAGQASVATLQSLRILADHGGDARVHELSAELGITIGAASKLVDRLERDGFARRRPHPEDRRSSFVSLTDAGTGILASGEEVTRDVLGRLVGDDDDVRATADSLVRLTERLAAGAAA